MCRLHRDNASDPVARAILDRLVADKTRHAAFGWFYLESRAAGWSDADRQTIADEVAHVVIDIELHGLRCAWLAGDAAADIVAADRLTREAGLGAATRDEEEPVLRRFLARGSRDGATSALASGRQAPGAPRCSPADAGLRP